MSSLTVRTFVFHLQFLPDVHNTMSFSRFFFFFSENSDVNTDKIEKRFLFEKKKTILPLCILWSGLKMQIRTIQIICRMKWEEKMKNLFLVCV